MPEQPCAFCAIIAGHIEASVVYEDDATIAFVDLRQPTAAHVLVVPKQHVEMIYDLPPDVAARLMQSVVQVAQAIRRSLQPAGLSVWQSNGEAVGQEVPHVHVHLLVRHLDDGLLRVYPSKPPYPDQAARNALAAAIKTGFIPAGA